MKTARRLSISGSSRSRGSSDSRTGDWRTGDGRTGISPVDIADHNSRTTLGLLRRFGPLTRQELSRHLGLTEPAITGIMQRLAAAGLVTGRKRTTASRYTAAEFVLCPEAAYSIGIRLQESGGEVAVIDLSCSVVRRECFATVEEMIEIVGRAKRSVAGKVVGCGVAVSGQASIDLQAIETAIGSAVAPLYGLSESEAAISAERMLGIGDPDGGLVTILIENTVRAGLLIGGRPFRGIHGLAGEIGEMRSGLDGASLNDVATLPSLERCLAADPASRDMWVDVAARHLHEAVLAISGFIAPGAILLGGALPDDILAAVIARMAQEREEKIRDLVIAPWIPTVRSATFPRTGVVLGAALRPFSETLFPA